ncbi:SDR family oxidoreductase [Shewanella putrefaciens]|uniref:SDR family NAD(P)-dependent oxidoreductase n=1 Tax=unclassified Shewanella TaxID=196818 RepID=UPI002005064D|nr:MULTISPECIES: SDR family oxidoreductase [unclassified Shewanella]MCK7630243.1 SDR family oxidoreductase [Shewanella sp. JNE9-1]MCK7653403.1 SDR family oxidoreductase [Shewanella sp. JNE4-1]
MRELLLGKNIAVVGASSGIGLAVGQFAAEQGANVVLGARRTEKLDENLLSLKGCGLHFSRTVDATDEKSVLSFVEFCVEQLGGLDGVVYCAGVHGLAPISLTSEKDFSHYFDTNVKGAQFLIKHSVKKKHYNASGLSIVLMSSSAARRGSGGAALYSASKGALESLTRSVAVEFAKKKVRCNSVAPGMVDTDISSQMKMTLGETGYERIISEHPLGIGAPENVAHSVCFLLSDYSNWITGTVVTVDGGFGA